MIKPKIYVSDIAAAIGKSSFKTPHRLYQELTGEVERESIGIYGRAGELLEQLVYEQLEQEGIDTTAKQVPLEIDRKTYKIRGRSDLVVDGANWSIKTTSNYQGIYDEWRIQATIEAYGLGVTSRIVYVVLERSSLKLYTHIEDYDQELCEQVLARLDDYMHYVISRTPPPVPVPTIEEVDQLVLDEDVSLRLAQLNDEIAALKRTVKDLEQARADLVTSLPPAHVLVAADGRKLAQVVMPKPRTTLDDDALMRAMPEVAQRYMRTVETKPYWRWYANTEDAQ
jgi:predicted phage-related endonuclease